MKPRSIFNPMLAILTSMVMPFWATSQGSNANNYIPPSPSAMTFLKYGEYPVSHSTGVPDISIPLYTIDLGDFSFPISATFHSSGRTAYFNFSPLGLNWNLNGYGMISREVRGKSDESFGVIRDNIEEPESFYMPSLPEDRYTRKDSYEKQLRLVGEYPGQTPWDGEYDIYTLSMPGVSAKFIIRQNGEVLFLSHVPYRLTRTSADIFTLIDERGVEYVFGPGAISGHSNSYGFLESSDFGPSSWLLQRVTTPSGRQIRFRYGSVSTGTAGHMSGNLTFVDQLTIGDFAHAIDGGPPAYLSSYSHLLTPTLTSSSASERQYIVGYLLAVEYDFGTLDFTYGTTLFLNDMKIKDKSGALLRTITFQQGSYFTGSNPPVTPNNNSKTVFAIQFENPSGVAQERYTFDYYTTEDEQGNYNDRAKDLWGYANTNSTLSLIPVGEVPRYDSYSGPPITYTVGSTTSRAPNLQRKQIGMIKRIHFPTGGHSEFIYQENKYRDGSNVIQHGPGLRIHKIINNDGAGVSVTKEYKYGANEDGIGKLLWLPKEEDFETVQLVTYGLTYELTSLLQGYIKTGDQYRMRTYSSDPSPHISAAYRLPVYYQEVAEYTYSSDIAQSNGKTIYKYSLPIFEAPYKPLSIFGVDQFNFQAFAFRDWSTPQLLNRTDYRRDSGTPVFAPVREHRYNYQPLRTVEIPQMLAHRLHRVPDSGPTSGELNDDEVFVATEDGTGLPWPVLNVLEYKLHAAANKLVSETTIAYESGSVAHQTVTNYSYDSSDHLFPTATEVTNSDGTKQVARMVYPQDYPNTSGFIDDMKDNHIVGVPIESVVTREVGSTRTILSGSITTYKAGSKGQIDQVLELETAAPVPSASFRFSNQSSVNQLPHAIDTADYSPDPAYKSRLAYNSYDTKGNPLQVTETGGLSTSYLWSYNGQYPVARVQNAVQSDIAYADFESDGKGNWTYSGATAADISAPSGKRTYSLGGGALSKNGLNSAGSYLLTYWSMWGVPTVSGSSGSTVSAATVMQTKGTIWTQYRRVISGATSVSLGGSVPVDDVRLHPIEAQMETYTYDPLVGMTTSTDASGNVFYYEYDEFGRLKLVRDLKGNRKEEYKYNYRNQ